MAARGSVAKQEITQKILETFPNSFLYNDGKEIRINTKENGEAIQIKCVLTAAKVAVEGGSGFEPSDNDTVKVNFASAPANEKVPQEPTEEEKNRLTDLLNQLGL